MKKILILINFIAILLSCAFGIEEEIVLDETIDNKVENQKFFEEESNKDKNNLKGILTKEYDLNSIDGMFKEQQTFKFKKGIFDETYTQFNIVSTLTEEIPEDGKGNLKQNFNVLNFAYRGRFKGRHESFRVLADISPRHENFFHRLISDAFIETNRIPHHSVIFGTSRPFVGLEGGTSAHLMPLLTRSQTSRNFGAIRKTGIRIKGDFKYVNYDVGGFSSDTFYSEFFPGVETDLWVNFKPLANFNNEKTGSLNIAGGMQIGNRNHHNFRVISTALNYNYKKLSLISEFQYANGSNGGSGITEDERFGYNTTLIYKLTKKIHLIARYDDFNNNVHIKHNNSREYSLGMSYFVLGQTLKFMLNYVYCQNMLSKDSHKIILGGQLLL